MSGERLSDPVEPTVEWAAPSEQWRTNDQSANDAPGCIKGVFIALIDSAKVILNRGGETVNSNQTR